MFNRIFFGYLILVLISLWLCDLSFRGTLTPRSNFAEIEFCWIAIIILLTAGAMFLNAIKAKQGEVKSVRTIYYPTPEEEEQIEKQLDEEMELREKLSYARFQFKVEQIRKDFSDAL